jgi:hypothetical protein
MVLNFILPEDAPVAKAEAKMEQTQDDFVDEA